MHPLSDTLDPISKSQDLASIILSSSTPSQISSACTSISSFLHSLPPDHSRHFFSATFPYLICKLYGFDHSASPPPPPGPHHHTHSSWLDTVLHQNDTELASRVFNLLSPDSTLFQSISAVDRLSLVKYVFPIERLPEWARFLFSSSSSQKDLINLCPLFKGKIKLDSSSPCHIQLNVFEYFMFWFAYHPICKGNLDNSKNVSTSRTKKFKLENWADSIRGFSSSHNAKHGDKEVKLECNLYLRLLYAYLRAFVPVYNLNTHQPYRSSLLHYGCGNDGSVMLRAEFFVDTLVQYWLVDNDFSPFSVSACKSLGLSLCGLRSLSGETLPPTANLGEVVKLLVKYLNLSSVGAVKEGGESLECLKSRELLASGVNSLHGVGSWNLWIQRPLYRFILRTFLLSPVGASMKNASEVFSVWVAYMQPWNIRLDDFSKLDAVVDGSAKDVKKEDGTSKEEGYSSLWQVYVLSNYLYYSSLVMHFIGFAHKFLHSDPEVIVQMVLKVLKMLTSSKGLIDLIKNMDYVFHSKQVGPGKIMPNNFYKYVPLIHEQLQDWEDGLCESDVDGSFLHENWNKDLRLFSDGEDGGQQLLQLFILRAEAELQANSGDNLAKNLQCIDSLKLEVSCLFGGHTVKPISFTRETKQRHEQYRGEIFKPRRVGTGAMTDVKYRGDWMKRPISDDEVAWLAKLLVWLSSWLNESLGLDQAENDEVAPKWSYVEVSSDVSHVCGPAETMKTVLCAVVSWLVMLSAAVIGQMRKHGLRVNLRMLASKKIVMVLLASALFSILRKTLGLFHRV